MAGRAFQRILTGTSQANAADARILSIATTFVGSRGRLSRGCFLQSLLPSKIQYGFVHQPVDDSFLDCFNEVTTATESILDQCGFASYLSHLPEAKFFRRLAAAFPEVLDVLLCTDDMSWPSVLRLQEGLKFLAAAVEKVGAASRSELRKSNSCHFDLCFCFASRWVTQADQSSISRFGSATSVLSSTSW
jgi:hypothetical protein